ncbi:MAG: serine hydrolase [Candidatus Latescibacteria bacterium]|nr:serine hydrolase [Candidatus Latescibacterota bacterium]
MYFPSSDWTQKTPDEVGIDGALLEEAIAFATDPAHAGAPSDLAAYLRDQNGGRKQDDGATVGPTKSHGPVTGVVLRHGYRIAEWGDPERVDMTFSISKSFLSTVCGLAWDKGLIRDLNHRVGAYIDDGGYDSDHNAQITWDHLLRQISEWDGTLWDKPYAAGNPDDVLRTPQTPGTHYEYNDVRVNRFALSLLRVYKQPLPEILKAEVMDPIGASDSWQWHGYDNSWVDVDGKQVQSVSGGGHWGGGMWISALDLARFGHLSLNRGVWNGRQILSEDWVKMATTPTALRPTYGFMNWFLNTNRELMPSAPENHFFHGGAGTNRVWVAPELDLVVVLRWVSGDYYDGFVQRVLAAVS